MEATPQTIERSPTQEAERALLGVYAEDVATIALRRGHDNPATARQFTRLTEHVATQWYDGDMTPAAIEAAAALVDEHRIDALRTLNREELPILDTNPVTGETKLVSVEDYATQHQIAMSEIDTQEIVMPVLPEPPVEAQVELSTAHEVNTQEQPRETILRRIMGAVAFLKADTQKAP